MGAPKGNNNRRAGLLLKQALTKALARKHAENGKPKSRSDAQKALEDIMFAVVCKASEGDQWAVDTLLDRAFGKPKQEVEQTGLKTITGIEVTFVRPELEAPKLEKIVNGQVIHQEPVRIQEQHDPVQLDPEQQEPKYLS